MTTIDAPTKTPDELLTEVARLATELRTTAATSDRSGELDAGTFERLRAAGLTAALVPAEFGGAGERGRASADESDAFAGVRRGREGMRYACVVERLHGIALEAGDRDGFAFSVIHNAGAFAEHVDGARA